MANKLDRDQIEALKAEGLSVRKIAERLSEMNGAKVSPSSVHYMLSKENGNGENKESVQVDQTAVRGVADSIEVRLNELKAQLDRIEQAVTFVHVQYGRGGGIVTVHYKDADRVVQPKEPWYIECLFWVGDKVMKLFG